MRMEEFMALEAPERYDFSNDGANSAYNRLNNAGNDCEKFFTYMAVQRAKGYKKPTTENIMKYGYDYSMKCKKEFENIPDPDSESKLLQEIYTLLWDKPNLQCCKNENEDVIKGDTMHSANTTLCTLYRLEMETPENIKERELIKTKNGSQNVSIRYILSRYAEDVQGHEKQFDKIEGMKFFTSIYHTLGNFIPVPAGCNAPRGKGKLQDYWDLALKAVYEYYVMGSSDHIEDITGKGKSEIYKKWLDSFQDWDCFVEKNYLQDFVNFENYEVSFCSGFTYYGKPKELWKGHFSMFDESGDALPKEKEQIEQFYINASSWITARGVRMVQRLRQIQ